MFAHHPRAAHFRYPYVYGPHQLVPREWLIVRRILDGRDRIVVADDGLTLHHHGYTENLAHALLLAIDQPDAAAGKVFNIGDEEVLSIRQVIELIAAARSAPARDRLDAVRARGPGAAIARATAADPSCARHQPRADRSRLPRRGAGARSRSPRPRAGSSTIRARRGGQEEIVLTDPFDYAAEDRLDRRVARGDRARCPIRVRDRARLRPRLQRTGRPTPQPTRSSTHEHDPLPARRHQDRRPVDRAHRARTPSRCSATRAPTSSRSNDRASATSAATSACRSTDSSALAQMCNRGKRSLALDVHQPDGREILLQLVGDGRRRRAELPARRRRTARHRLRRRARGERTRRLRVALGVRPDRSVRGQGRVRHGDPGVRRLRREPGRPADRRAALPEPDRGRQGDRAVRRAGDHRRAVRARTHRRGPHVQLAMLDAVVSFLWADAAGNEVLQDADRSQPSSFVAQLPALPFPRRVGHLHPDVRRRLPGHVPGVRRRRLRRPARRDDRSNARSTASCCGEIMDRCYAAATEMTTADAIGALEAHNVPCGVVLSPDRARSRSRTPQAIGLFEDSVHPTAGRLRQPRHPTRVRRHPATARRSRAHARRAHRRDPARARPRAIASPNSAPPASPAEVRSGGVVAPRQLPHGPNRQRCPGGRPDVPFLVGPRVHR